jgi:hypothetical protein
MRSMMVSGLTQRRSKTTVQEPSRQREDGDERDETEDSPQQKTQQLACLIRPDAGIGTPRAKDPPTTVHSPAAMLKLARITIEWTYG